MREIAWAPTQPKPGPISAPGRDHRHDLTPHQIKDEGARRPERPELAHRRIDLSDQYGN
jgi:hypothetical protein